MESAVSAGRAGVQQRLTKINQQHFGVKGSNQQKTGINYQNLENKNLDLPSCFFLDPPSSPDRSGICV